LLDVSLPWSTFIGQSSEPGRLSRIGPITGDQAMQLANLALADYDVQWRVILTDEDGHAIAVSRVPRRRPAGVPARDGTSLVDRITITMSSAVVEPTLAGGLGRMTIPPWQDSGSILSAILRAAEVALRRARQLAEADDQAPGGCAHLVASAAYRPPARIREYITARDLTCRYPYCGQPAWRGDLDHTVPWDQGGLTCSCNLGPLCRTHHILKQLPGWRLDQVRPGIFRWTTPAGATYLTTVDVQPS
jgi:hypothetical protein